MNKQHDNKSSASQRSTRGLSRAFMILTGSAAAVCLMVAISTGQSAAVDGTTPAPAEGVTTAKPADVTKANSSALVKDTNGDTAITIMVNKSQVLNTRVPYKRLNVAQPDIADVNPIGPTSILVTAKKVGATQIIVWDDQDRSQIIDINVAFDFQELQERLKTSLPGSDIEVTTMSGSIALHGHAKNTLASERAMTIAQAYAPKVLNLMDTHAGQQVMLQVRFAEVSRNATTSLGFSGSATDGKFSFGTQNGASGQPIGGLATHLAADQVSIPSGVSIFGGGQAGNTAFEYFLSALRQNNLLRVLAEPNVVAISGQKASFLAGGEFPIPVPQSNGSSTTITIEYKKFGIQLNFLPVVLGDGRIRLEVAPEVSDLDFTNAVIENGYRIPALTTRTVNTTVELQEGQTLAIAGLLSNHIEASSSTTPLLGDLPVLGALFRSVSYQRKETELVVMVTPRLVEGMNPEQTPPTPGSKWRHPSENDLFWMKDLGGDQTSATPTAPEAADAAATQQAEAPRFHGQYGYAAVEPQESK